MKKILLSFLLLFGLFEMGHTAGPLGTVFNFVERTCYRTLLKAVRPISPRAKLQWDIIKKFDRYGHKVFYMLNALGLNEDVYLKGLANLALALERGTPLAPYSRVITDITISANDRDVSVSNAVFGGLDVRISAYTPVEEIVPKMNIALLEHEIGQKRHQYGPTSFIFDQGSGVDDERLTSFLEKTFLKALDDDKDAARIADFPDRLVLKIVDEKISSVDFRSAVIYSGFNILISADASAESLFLRLANALLEEQVTVWMWEHYAYRGRAKGSAVINSGVDDAAYERGLKLLLEWFENPSLVRDAEHIFVRLGRIYVTENQLEIKPRQVSDDRETVFDIYVPSNGAEVNAKTFTRLLLPPAE